jgi:16S rRNA C967 or C1407 C5-methylase (RsmB/RsmF family)
MTATLVRSGDLMTVPLPLTSPPSPSCSIDHLRRYAPIVDDLAAFLAAADRPLPRVVWANPLYGTLAEIDAGIRAECPVAEAVSWRPHTWRLPPDERPGRWPLHTLGGIYGQEEAALWAGDLVGAQPGERVVDLCASPGGKAAQIAVAMADDGTLFANERSRGRLPALRHTLDRLGITCAVVTQFNGMHFPPVEGGYDRVLVDAPCTCEGTTRKSAGGRRTAPGEGYRDSIAQVQRALLRAGVRLARPGGTIVYATCTYAPEENEATLDAIPLDEAVIEPIEAPPGLTVAPGLTAWEGRRFRPDVINAARIWPHHNDTGGFFVARLRRL